MKSLTLARRTVLGLVLSVAASPLVAQDRPTVAADSYPLAYFADRLGAGAVDVIFPVPAGTDPSFWRPGVSDIAAIQGARVIALNGAGFSTWPTKASLPRSRTVETSAGFADSLIRTETVTHSHGDDGEHSHTATASYTWLDFSLASQQAEALADAMIRQIPDLAAEIESERDALLADLSALDERARAVIGDAAIGPVIASHPRYQYFARAYDLTIHSVDWDAREEPTEDQWAALDAMVVETGAKAFVWEAEPSEAALSRIGELGLVSVVMPPLANKPDEGDFMDHMNASLDRIEAASDQS
ncbi:MAG: metal ABC transporter substrate-binding protein [Loktanella sp.]|nr:metal ABC transporter substrate-binding protein [Loktanella sp.]